MHLLVAEDEQHLRQILVKRLTEEGYAVDGCEDGEEALDYIRLTDYDGVVLDIMMPKLDGLAVLLHMRAEGIKTPVLLLTAKDSIEDRVRGLDAGADDYLVKPFAFDELLARVRVLTRRKSDHPTNRFVLADLTVDTASHQVWRGEQPIALSSKEFALLEYLIRNQGTVLTRSAIEQHVWGYGYEGGSNLVDVYIRYLRRKIDHGYEEKLLHTVRGVGYTLRAER